MFYTHQLCLTRDVYLRAEIGLCGIQTVAAHGATHGTLGVDVHLALHLLCAQCARIYRCAVLGVCATSNREPIRGREARSVSIIFSRANVSFSSHCGSTSTFALSASSLFPSSLLVEAMLSLLKRLLSDTRFVCVRTVARGRFGSCSFASLEAGALTLAAGFTSVATSAVAVGVTLGVAICGATGVAGSTFGIAGAGITSALRVTGVAGAGA